MHSAQTSLSETEFSKALQSALPMLWGYARRLTRDNDAADDLVQDAACKAWAARRSFERGTSFNAWLCTILRNRFLSEIRRAKWRAPMPDNFDIPIVPSQLDHLYLLEVEKKVQKLPAQQRTAVLLAMEGVSYEEAATIMNCRVGTVKSRLGRARASLGMPPSQDMPPSSNAGR